MSFEQQEAAMLSLLFDRELREAFLRDRDSALAAFELSETERADFATVRRAGLEIDAEARRDLVLARLCRSLPLSFSIASALAPSSTSALLTAAFFRVPVVERSVRFAEQLRADIMRDAPPLVAAVLDLEIGMAALGADARRAAIERASPDVVAPRVADWADRRLALAPNTGVFRLPRSYADLVRELCPCAPDQLWARLQQAPLPRGRLEHVLADEQPRLLAVRVLVERASRCEASVSQRTVELADGFFPLLQQVATGSTTTEVCHALLRAGANATLVAGVRAGLDALVEQQLLVVARSVD